MMSGVVVVRCCLRFVGACCLLVRVVSCVMLAVCNTLFVVCSVVLVLFAA